MMHHRSQPDKSANVVGIAVLAAAAGAIAGLLFAPKSGRETRKEIRAKVQDMKAKGAEKASQARDKVHQLNKSSNDKVDEVVDKAAATAKQKADETARRSREL